MESESGFEEIGFRVRFLIVEGGGSPIRKDLEKPDCHGRDAI